MRGRVFLIIVLTILATAVAFSVIDRKALPLVSPLLKQDNKQPSPMPSASLLNPPEEVKYDSSTNLQEELDSVNPQINDSDFEE